MKRIIARLVPLAFRRRLRSFADDERGVSVVEFALLAPAIAVTLVGVVEYGSLMYDRTDMHAAVRSGAQYVMNGGRDTVAARNIVLRAWSTVPDDAVVNAVRYCLCSEAAHACNTPCPDASVPQAYIRIEASATIGGMVFDYGQHANEVIRIR